MRPGWHQQNTPWIDRLARLGLEPQDIDIVLCTHLHADHVGLGIPASSTVAGCRPFHMRATCSGAMNIATGSRRVAAHHGDEPLNHGSFDDSVLPVVEAGQVELIDSDFQIDRGHLAGAGARPYAWQCRAASAARRRACGLQWRRNAQCGSTRRSDAVEPLLSRPGYLAAHPHSAGERLALRRHPMWCYCRPTFPHLPPVTSSATATHLPTTAAGDG